MSAAQSIPLQSLSRKNPCCIANFSRRSIPDRRIMVRTLDCRNREWEGCNVNDPSARALSNYGASAV